MYFYINGTIACITNMFSAVAEELTNLIIMRNCSSVEAPGSPTTEGNKFSHIQFHMIKYEDLTWVSCFTSVRPVALKRLITHRYF